MKKLSLLLTLLLPLFLNAKIVINHPQCGMSKESYVKIEKIVLKKNVTILQFKVKIRAGFKIFIPKTTYIQPEGGEKLEIIGAKGINLDKWFRIPNKGELTYTLKFPPIEPTCTKLDYSEGIGSGAWFFYDVQLKETPSTKKIPEEIFGKWHNPNDGTLALCLFDTLAVYKNTVFSYDTIDMNNGNGNITLKSPINTFKLYIQHSDTGLFIGEQNNNLTKLLSGRSVHSCGAKELTPPILKNDTAVYSGYIYKYNPKCDVNTLTISIKNIFTNNQSTFKATINTDGYFSVKIPMLHPHHCTMRTDFFMTTHLYLEPGKELFHVISFDYNRRKTHEYMGELAGVNNELEQIKKLDSSNRSDILKQILDIDAHKYASHYKDLWNKDLQELELKYEFGEISAKTYQIKKTDLQYSYANRILMYENVFESSYRKANKIDRKQRDLGIEISHPNLNDLNFIDNAFANNEIALVSNNYSYFVNRMKYTDLLGKPKISISPTDAIDLYLVDHTSLSDFEKTMIKGIQIQDSIRKLPEFVSYAALYQTKEIEFVKKYRDELILLTDSLKTNFSYEKMKNYLESNGNVLTYEENDLVAANMFLNKNDFMDKIKTVFEGLSRDSINVFYKSLNVYFQQINKNKRRDIRDDGFKKIFNIDKGLMSDILFAQELCRSIVKEMTPMDRAKLEIELTPFTNPVISDYIRRCNQQTITTNAYRKAHPLASVHDVPNVTDEKLFEAIIKSYKGKVVYVDFWATWCSPCLSGIERIAPLKDELENENLAFVYITSETSPIGTWNNMIPNIKGEHYRVNGDQWKYLCNQFGVTGIPHYMMIDAEGNIINEHLPHLSNSEIKKMLMELQLK